MLSKLSKVTQPINDRAENWNLIHKASVLSSFPIPFCLLYHQEQWDVMMGHMLVKFHYGSVLAVFTPESRKAFLKEFSSRTTGISYTFLDGEMKGRQLWSCQLDSKRLEESSYGKTRLPDVSGKVSGLVYQKSPVSNLIWDESQTSI